MKIRSMLIGDIPAVLKIGLSTEGFRVTEKQEDYFWSRDQLVSWVASDDVLLVAESGGAVVGFVLTTHHKPTGKVTWENQVVLPEFQGQGIAKALTEEMEKRLKKAGARYIHFLVKVDNPAIEHYKHLDYDVGQSFVWFGKHI